MQNNEASPSTVLFPVFVRVQQLHDVPSLKTMSHVRAGLQKVPVPRKGATRAGIPVMHTSEAHNQHESVYGCILHPTAVCHHFVMGNSMNLLINASLTNWLPSAKSALAGCQHHTLVRIGPKAMCWCAHATSNRTKHCTIGHTPNKHNNMSANCKVAANLLSNLNNRCLFWKFTLQTPAWSTGPLGHTRGWRKAGLATARIRRAKMFFCCICWFLLSACTRFTCSLMQPMRVHAHISTHTNTYTHFRAKYMETNSQTYTHN